MHTHDADRRRDARRRLARRMAALASAACLPWWAMPTAAHSDKPHVARRPLKKEQQAWGIAGEAGAARRTVEVRMLDTMRFVPDRIEVRHGETLRLRVHNAGRLMHEFVIGTPQENRAHAELMKKFPNMEHDEPWMAHVGPGKTGEIVWRFNRLGEFEFACLMAGHYDAGMVGRIVVSAA